METWGGGLDDNSYQASINLDAQIGVTYQVDQFYNGIGSVNGVSSSRITGDNCVVEFNFTSRIIKLQILLIEHCLGKFFRWFVKYSFR